MRQSAYTLLIVESPVIAEIIQKKVPSFVYVIATGGYCWHPVYNAEKNKLTTRADPQKRKLRKELKEQAEWAGNIIIATDNDPSGDFITWSVLRFLKSAELKRGYLQNISRNGIHKLLDEAVTFDEAHLKTRLKNRFLIRHEWFRSSVPLTLQQAGLATVLGQPGTFQTFSDEDGAIFKSSKPILCNSDKWLTTRATEAEELYREEKPLSAFDVVDKFSKQSKHLSFYNIQVLLQCLFQTQLQYSEESLISYPRTSENTFYRDTWADLKDQYMKFGSVNDLKPIFLQQTPVVNAPHESIHSLNLALTPERVRGELPQDITLLYEMIHKHTMKTLKMPSLFKKVYASSAHNNVYFYPLKDRNYHKTVKLSPALTIAELGSSLNRLGLQPASSFGKNIDKWLSEKWIILDNGAVKAGSKLIPHIASVRTFRKKLTSLLQVSDDPQLKPETVKALITS